MWSKKYHNKCMKIIRKPLSWYNNDNMDDTQKLTFENINKVNAYGVDSNLIKWIIIQKHN